MVASKNNSYFYVIFLASTYIIAGKREKSLHFFNFVNNNQWTALQPIGYLAVIDIKKSIVKYTPHSGIWIDLAIIKSSSIEIVEVNLNLMSPASQVINLSLYPPSTSKM